jgi:hypothetical protein
MQYPFNLHSLTVCLTIGASATTPWPIAAIVSSTSAELTAGVDNEKSLTTGETTTGFCKSRGTSILTKIPKVFFQCPLPRV